MLCVYMCVFACYCFRNTNLSALALIETFVSARGYTQAMCVCERETERGGGAVLARHFSSICPPRGRSGKGEINWRKRINQC